MSPAHHVGLSLEIFPLCFGGRSRKKREPILYRELGAVPGGSRSV